MGDIRAPQSATLALIRQTTSNLRLPQSGVMGIYNMPTDFIRGTEGFVQTVFRQMADIRNTHSSLLAIVRGKVFDPRVRSWTFTLDGHDFYVLRLGNTETLVYDTYSNEWSVYGSNDTRLWKAYTGSNWLGGDKLAATYGSNVVVGDDSNGALYLLDPDYDYDDHSSSGAADKLDFKREAQAQVVLKGYDSVSCFGVELEGSIGDAAAFSNTVVNLKYSDDRGKTYDDAGNILATEQDYRTRLNWQSLGSMNVPGRLFKFADWGALKRIDSAVAVTDLPEG